MYYDKQAQGEKEQRIQDLGKSNKELNALSEKKFHKFVKKKKGRKKKKCSSIFKKCRFPMMKAKKLLQLGRKHGKRRNLILQF